MRRPTSREHAINTVSTERRQFSRVAFDAEAEIITTQDRLVVRVQDLSLKGALLQLPEGVAITPGAPCLLKVSLSALNTHIAMAGELTHVEGGHAGMLCRSIDLESITHLRRLIAMNLGDASLLDRELKALIS